jgi:hypothetical protein
MQAASHRSSSGSVKNQQYISTAAQRSKQLMQQRTECAAATAAAAVSQHTTMLAVADSRHTAPVQTLHRPSSISVRIVHPCEQCIYTRAPLLSDASFRDEKASAVYARKQGDRCNNAPKWRSSA